MFQLNVQIFLHLHIVTRWIEHNAQDNASKLMQKVDYCVQYGTPLCFKWNCLFLFEYVHTHSGDAKHILNLKKGVT